MQGKKGMTLEEVFWEGVDLGAQGDCWGWLKSFHRQGYGQVGHANKTLRSHRVSYTLYVSPIPEGLYICHHCDNRWCVNPHHLFVGTHTDNMRDMVNKNRDRYRNKTHCPEGHLLQGDNLYLSPKSGHRSCRECRRKRGQELMERHKLGIVPKWRGPNHCPHGHDYTPENTHITVKGGRECRKCRRDRAREKNQERARVISTLAGTISQLPASKFQLAGV